jgi:hypothetical protein
MRFLLQLNRSLTLSTTALIAVVAASASGARAQTPLGMHADVSASGPGGQCSATQDAPPSAGPMNIACAIGSASGSAQLSPGINAFVSATALATAGSKSDIIAWVPEFFQLSGDLSRISTFSATSMYFASFVDFAANRNSAGLIVGGLNADGTFSPINIISNILDNVPSLGTNQITTVSSFAGIRAPTDVFFYNLYVEAHSGGVNPTEETATVYAPTFKFFDVNGEDITADYTFIFDPATPLTATPEPSTFALMASGLSSLAGAGFWRRRRRG